MIRTYACTHCKAELFTGNLKALFTKRHQDAPPYIEMTCSHCGQLNQLSYSPDEEVTKADKQSKPLFGG